MRLSEALRNKQGDQSLRAMAQDIGVSVGTVEAATSHSHLTSLITPQPIPTNPDCKQGVAKNPPNP